MQVDILREVASSVAGEKAKSIVDLLFGKKNVNEFIIAKKLKLTINQTRNVLYKLGDEGLVSFVRKKDKKKGGWYIYFWTLNLDKGMVKFKDALSEKLNNLNAQEQSKKNARFYHCPNCNIESSEETALTHDYTCPECGQILELKDNSKEVLLIEKEVERIESLLVNVEAEIKINEQKGQKSKMRRLKAEEKKKKSEREAKKKKKQRELKKLKKLKTPIKKAKSKKGKR